MSFLRSNLKIFKPERIGSQPNAGGHRTMNAIVSGKLNEVFSSISDVDHARSAFDLVKLYPALATTGDERLQDAHIFISDQPDDPLVNTLLVESPYLRDDSELMHMLMLMTTSDTKYHGTSLLTKAVNANEKTIDVEQVSRSLAPTVVNKHSKVGVKPEEESQISLYRTHRIQSYGELTEFNVEIPDIMLGRPQFKVSYQRKTINGIYAVPTGGVLLGKNISGSLPAHLPLYNGLYLTIRYMSAEDFRFHSFDAGQITLAAGESVLPESVQLKKQGSETVYKDDGQGRFISGGYIFATIDYETGAITEIQPVDYVGTVEESLGALVQLKALSIREKQFSMPTDKFTRESLYIRCTSTTGVELSASSDASGNITGTNITGSVNSSGFVELTFSVDIKPDSISYDYEALVETNVPAPPGGIDRSRLPEGGYVPIFHQFNLVCIQNRSRITQPTLNVNDVINIEANADFVDIVDSNLQSLYSPTNDNYAYDPVTGEITIASGISSFISPFIITSVVSELALIDSINSKTLQLLSPLKKSYPVGATVSSVYVLGDLQAYTKDERTLSAWQNNFDDTGAIASSAVNTVQYPIELSNLGSIAQKWAVVFTSTTAFNVYGEHVGLVYSSDTTVDCAPINSFAASPYFTIRKEAFGAGLNPGECFLFETTTASKPIMLTRSVSPGHSNIERDNSTLAFRGNKD
tara:strand:- start:3372 stop:5456 length:2085 start_codon:yes stop_codon:yes gene_type:complete